MLLNTAATTTRSIRKILLVSRLFVLVHWVFLPSVLYFIFYETNSLLIDVKYVCVFSVFAYVMYGFCCHF